MTDAPCRTCKFFWSDYSLCRRYPPVPHLVHVEMDPNKVVTGYVSQSIYPTMDADNGTCGEHKPSILKVN